MTTPRLLPASEAAIYLGWPAETGIGWLAKRRCYGDGPPYVRLGGRVFYDMADLDRWIEQNKRRSTSDLTNLSASAEEGSKRPDRLALANVSPKARR